MLFNFRFKNCRSFLDETNLSLEATADKEYRELNTFFVDEKITGKGHNELLKAAIIFGHNASGKSNVLKLLAYMQKVVLTSGVDHTAVLSNEPFLLRENAPNDESRYEVEFIQNNSFYKYGFSILKGKIIREWLYKKFERLTLIFEREGNKITKIRGTNKQVAAFFNIASSTCLFISLANNFVLEISSYIKDVNDWFSNLMIVFNNNVNNLNIYDFENEKYKIEAVEILKRAELGLEDITIYKDKIGGFEEENNLMSFKSNVLNTYTKIQSKNEAESSYNIDLETTFNVYNDKHEVVDKLNVSIFKNPSFHSEGTIRLINYLGIILFALDKGRVLVLDELDTKLHFIISEYILELFNSIAGNQKNAQFICTANNALLMDDNIRRDQIYFTSKNRYGESTMLSLADYKNVRKDISYSKKYLVGFYTDLPDIKTW